MKIEFYELTGDNGKIFSPWCWTVRLALLHKKIDFITRSVKFGEIKNIDKGQFKTVPIVGDGQDYINDSVAVAAWLDEKFPDRPKLFHSVTEKNQADFIKNYCAACLASYISRLIIHDIYKCVHDDDKQYYRNSREKYFGMKLEKIQQEHREKGEAYEIFSKNLRAITMSLKKKPFLGGDSPAFVDYQIFGIISWPLTCSDFIKSKLNETIKIWYENMQEKFDLKN